MIIDAHCHLGRSPQFCFPDVTVRTMLAVMDRLGIERAVCCHLAMLQGAWDLGYRESLEAFGEAPDRIVFHAAYDPNDPRSLGLVDGCLEREEFVGVKIHPSLHGCPADDDRYDAIWQIAAQRQVPILTHSWDVSEENPAQELSFPRRFETYVARYPEVTLILGHSGGRYHGHIAAAEMARRYPNVLLDTSGDCYTLGLIEYLIEEAGSDKLMFGSDMAWIDPRTQLGVILDADVPTETKRKILGGNAARVFNFAEAVSDDDRS